MKLRKYKEKDCLVLADLFYHTVHTINAKDYSKAQVDAWATGKINIAAWNQSFCEHDTLVAEQNGIIVGFGDMDHSGYLDRLYVHRDYQRQGIASAIVNQLEQHALLHGISVFTTHASITAKPFFEHQGYALICENIVVRGGIPLTNFTMKKQVAR